MIELTKDEKSALLRRYRRDGEKGAISIQMCPRCGHIAWSCTDNNKESDEVHVENWDDNFNGWRCERCVEVQRRHPELFDWMLGVVTFAMRVSGKCQR